MIAPATRSCQPWNRPEPSNSTVKYPTTMLAARPQITFRSSARPNPSRPPPAALTSRMPCARIPIDPRPACMTVYTTAQARPRTAKSGPATRSGPSRSRLDIATAISTIVGTSTATAKPMAASMT